MSTIKISNRIIGDNNPTYTIAEIGINHNGNFELAKKMIYIAKECGIDCVKFQKRNLSYIYKSDVLKNPHLFSVGLGIYIPILKEVEFTIDQHFELKEYCKDLNIHYLCTPFDIISAKELFQINVDAFKIASINMTNKKLLEYISIFNKPILVSTGMTSWHNIEDINIFLQQLNAQYMFLHCVSTYPVDFKDINLSLINKLNEIHNPIGYSGHERGIEISVCAVAMGASIIERHFTLDRTMKGPDHACSLEPEGLKRMVRHIRDFELARGSGIKKITRGEQLVKESLGGEVLCTGV